MSSCLTSLYWGQTHPFLLDNYRFFVKKSASVSQGM